MRPFFIGYTTPFLELLLGLLNRNHYYNPVLFFIET